MYSRRRSGYAILGLLIGRRRFKQIVILLLLAALGMGGGLFLRGRVVFVADGDSLEILDSDFQRLRVRLYGIDCPEGRQKGGPEAAAFTRSLTLFEEVRLTVVERDRYQRAVALVTLSDGRSLNEELLRAGHAWFYERYCDLPQCAAWRKLEKEARQARIGLWADKAPRAPWQWRRQHRSKAD